MDLPELEAQRRQGDATAVAEPAHDVGERDAHFIIEHFAKVILAGKVADRADIHAGNTHLADYPGQALVPRGIGIGADEEFLVARIAPETGPDLVPGDDQAVAIDHAARADGREV